MVSCALVLVTPITPNIGTCRGERLPENKLKRANLLLLVTEDEQLPADQAFWNIPHTPRAPSLRLPGSLSPSTCWNCPGTAGHPPHFPPLCIFRPFSICIFFLFFIICIINTPSQASSPFSPAPPHPPSLPQAKHSESSWSSDFPRPFLPTLCSTPFSFNFFFFLSCLHTVFQSSLQILFP